MTPGDARNYFIRQRKTALSLGAGKELREKLIELVYDADPLCQFDGSFYQQAILRLCAEYDHNCNHPKQRKPAKRIVSK